MYVFGQLPLSIMFRILNFQHQWVRGGQIGLETLSRMAILSLLRLSARLQYQQSLSAIIGYVTLLMVFERSSRTSKLVE